MTNSLDAAFNSRYEDRKAIYKRLFGDGDQSSDTMSPSYTGSWIEISIQYISSIAQSMSHPIRVRGLK